MESEIREAEIGSAAERNIFFWVLLGPFALVALFAILFLFFPASSWILPSLVIAGFLLIWLFRKPGLILSNGLVFASALYTFYTVPEPRLVSFELAHISLLLTFWVLYLSQEEAATLLLTLKENERHHATTSSETAKESERRAETHLQIEKELLRKLQEAEILLKRKEDESQSFENVHELSRLELVSALSKQEEMSRENFHLREELAAVQNHPPLIEELREKASSLAEEKYMLEMRIEQADLLLKKKEEELLAFENIHELARSELLSALSKQEEMSREGFHLRQVIAKLQEDQEDESTVKNLLAAEQDRAIDELRQKVASLEEEKSVAKVGEASFNEGPLTEEVSEQNFRKLLGKWKQLRSQFEEKSALLDQTRKELFHAQEESAFARKVLEEGDDSLKQWSFLEEEREALVAENEALRLHLNLIAK